MLRLLLLLIFCFYALALSGQHTRSQFIVDQPDVDSRAIKGRSGTHHWQPYMAHADLGGYRHAPEEAVEDLWNSKEINELP